MQGTIRAAQRWPVWCRVAITLAVIAAACLLQLPLEREVPGEPFLLFFLVVIGSTLAFGARLGFLAVGISTFLSVLFFEPTGTLALRHAPDLIKIEVYAILAGGCVIAFTSFGNALIAASDRGDALEQLHQKKSLLLREMAHGVANNFSAVAALISMRSISVHDREARSILDAAIEQVAVMGRIHRRLRGGGEDGWVDSQTLLRELCEDFQHMVCSRPLRIECKADSRRLPFDEAVLLGLIVNELVSNAVKHAFPDGRAGRISIGFETLSTCSRLSVADDGIGFGRSVRHRPEGGQGQDLVKGLSQQLGGDLAIDSGTSGSSFRLSIPFNALGIASAPSAKAMH
jgi:two-component system, sensor histidine kinase PdtaS